MNLKKSVLLQINLLMCETCISSKYEPRWAVVIAGRQYGADLVKEFVMKKRYCGNDITASELLI